LTSVCVAWETRRAFDRIPLTSVFQLAKKTTEKEEVRWRKMRREYLMERRRRQKRCEWLGKIGGEEEERRMKVMCNTNSYYILLSSRLNI